MNSSVLPLPEARRASRCPAAVVWLDDYAHAMVRVYLIACEERQHAHRKAWLQASCRRALLLAMHGIDVQPLRVRGSGAGQ